MKELKLENHVTFLSGFAFKAKSFNTVTEGIPVIRIRDVKRGFSETFFTGEYSEKYLIHNGDYLIGMDGEFNIAPWKSSPALLNQRVCKIDNTSDELDIHYLAKYLPLVLKKIEAETRFATVKHLSVKTLNQIKIPIPEGTPEESLKAQKKIAYLLEKVERLIAQRKKQIEDLDEFLKSVFIDMFGDPVKNDKGWSKDKLKTVLSSIDSGKSPKCESRPAEKNEWGVLKLGSVTYCQYQQKENKAIKADFQPNAKHEVKQGDLLFSRKNTYELVAACAYVSETRSKLLLPDLIFRLNINQDYEMDPIFLWKLLTNRSQRKKIQSLAGGAAGNMPNISKAKLNEASIIIPPTDIQTTFVEIVQKTEAIKSNLEGSLIDLQLLYDSLSQKAFSGELDLTKVVLEENCDDNPSGITFKKPKFKKVSSVNKQLENSDGNITEDSLLSIFNEHKKELDVSSLVKTLLRKNRALSSEESENYEESSTYDQVHQHIHSLLNKKVLVQNYDEQNNRVYLTLS